MTGYLDHLLARLPYLRDRIEALAGANDAFDDTAGKHRAVCDELAAGTADDPGERDRLERRRAALEEEMIHMLDGNART